MSVRFRKEIICQEKFVENVSTTTDYAVNVIKRGHCWKCGQLLDWSDDDEID